MQKSMRITMLLPILKALHVDQQQLDSLRPLLLQQLGLNEDDLRNQNLRLPIAQVDLLLELAKQFSNKPELGLIAGQQFELRNYGLLGFMLSYCENIAEISDLATRYYSYLSSDGAPRVAIENGLVNVRHLISFGTPSGEQTRAELFSLAIIRCAASLCSTPIKLQSLDFQFTEPEYSELYKTYFPGTEIHFSQPETRLIFSEECLSLKLDFPDPTLRQSLQKELDQRLAREQQQNVSQQVSNILTLQEQGFAFNLSMNEVAKMLNMSAKTLARRLADEKTSFKQLQENIRHQLAMQLLQNHQNKIDHIALELGFADRSSFDRSFCRIQGQTPANYRKTFRKNR